MIQYKQRLFPELTEERIKDHTKNGKRSENWVSAIDFCKGNQKKVVILLIYYRGASIPARYGKKPVYYGPIYGDKSANHDPVEKVASVRSCLPLRGLLHEEPSFLR